MASIRLLLFLTFLSLFLIFTSSKSDDVIDEDLAYLESQENDVIVPPHSDDLSDPDDVESDPDEFENYDDLDESEFDPDHEHDDEHVAAQVDEKDVVVLKEGNFTEFVKEKNRYVMVEFYAPWCGHCQALTPEYAAAATELKEAGVVLAKVDATEENELAQEYGVEGFPTVFFFIDGVHKPYNAPRSKDAIVSWIKKKIGPGISNITTIEEAERVLKSEDKVVMGFLNSLVGPDSEELGAASRLEDDVNFYQTVNSDVAKLFQLDANVKRPSLVLLKKEDEKLSRFDGLFTKSAIAEFVYANKLPLVTVFTRESAPAIFESPIKKQLLLFATSSDSVKILPIFLEASKLFKGKLLFVSVEMDNEDVGKPVSDYFGVSGDAAKVLAYTGNDDAKKFVFDGEVTLDNLKVFGDDFLEDKLKPFFKSDPIPKTNDGDVKIVVGNNFDEIVLDESKDVLLELYAPWCGHCQTLEPIYNKLAKNLHGIESMVIAKMDGTTNEHHRAKADGFPTILFFPAGNKSFDPITVDTDRTVVALYKFLKKHATIPFKLQKPASTPKPEESAKPKEESSSTTDIKDEL